MTQINANTQLTNLRSSASCPPLCIDTYAPHGHTWMRPPEAQLWALICGFLYFALMSSDLSEFAHGLVKLKSPQRTQRTQSLAAIIFATFALCYEKAPRNRTQMIRIRQIFTDNFKSVSIRAIRAIRVPSQTAKNATHSSSNLCDLCFLCGEVL